MSPTRPALPPRPHTLTADDPILGAVLPRVLPAGEPLSSPVETNQNLHAPKRTGWSHFPLQRIDFALALALTVAALAARWLFIARGETLLHSDEAIVGLMAQDIAEGTRYPVFFYGQRYMGALEAYVIAAVLPIVNNPITALRLGPACFFAALVAAQFLMLTRWLGRRGGVVAAAALIACAPPFLQWSISARGGYVEILLWGTLLWWAYSEWFIAPSSAPRRGRRHFVFGLLLGSGMWINPSIAVFAAPIALHALLNGPLAAARRHERIGRALARVDCVFPTFPVALPLLLAFGVAAATSIWSVWVDHGHVRHLLLLGLLPPPIAAAVLIAAVAFAALFILRRTNALSWLREKLPTLAPFILGTLIGLTPTLIYTFRQFTSGQAVEPTVPLGLRPLWTIGETLDYLARGLQMLFAADMRPYTDLVCVGRARPDRPLPDHLAAVMPAVDLIVIGALLSLAMLFIQRHGRAVRDMLRLRPGPHSPAAFLTLALAAVLGMYVLGGCSFNFATIRYLVPLFAILPGLLAASAVGWVIDPPAVDGTIIPARASRIKRTNAQTKGRSMTHPTLRGTTNSMPPSRPALCCIAALLTAWSIGQFALHEQLGPPHPLHRVADALQAKRVDFAVAEILDAHLLSYLTQQRPPIAEFDAFWPRLSHYRTRMPRTGPYRYVVHAADIDWMRDWTRHTWPGPPPPETTRLLWPRLKQLLREHPDEIVSREPLADGYELWTLKSMLPGTVQRAGEATTHNSLR